MPAEFCQSQNPMGQFQASSPEGEEAWKQAEIQAGTVFLKAIPDPINTSFAAYFAFCESRQTLALALAPQEANAIRQKTTYDKSTAAFFKGVKSPFSRGDGKQFLKSERQRISTLINPVS